MRTSSVYVILGLLLVGAPCAAFSADTAIVHSQSGSYRAVVEWGGDAQRWPEKNFWKATVQTRRGEVLYSVDHEVPFDVPFPAILLSDDGGSALVLRAFDGWVDFYGGDGGRVSRWRPFGEGPPDYERTLAASVSGGRAAVLFSGSAREDPCRLCLVTMDGNVERVWEMGDGHAASVFLSGEGELALAGTYSYGPAGPVRRTTILDIRTGRVQTLPVLMRSADARAEDGRVLLTDGFDVFEGFAFSALARVYSAPFLSAVSDVRYATDGFACVVDEVEAGTGGILYRNPRVFLFGGDGEVTDSVGLEGPSLRPSTLVQAEDGIRIRRDGESSPVR